MNQNPIYSTLAQEDPYYLDLVEECIAELPGYVAQLQALLNAGNQEEAVRLSHSIKGSGGSHGFPPIAEIAAQIEKQARAGDLSSAQEGIAVLKELLPRLRTVPEERPA